MVPGLAYRVSLGDKFLDIAYAKNRGELHFIEYSGATRSGYTPTFTSFQDFFEKQKPQQKPKEKPAEEKDV